MPNAWGRGRRLGLSTSSLRWDQMSIRTLRLLQAGSHGHLWECLVVDPLLEMMSHENVCNHQLSGNLHMCFSTWRISWGSGSPSRTRAPNHKTLVDQRLTRLGFLAWWVRAARSAIPKRIHTGTPNPVSLSHAQSKSQNQTRFSPSPPVPRAQLPQLPLVPRLRS